MPKVKVRIHACGFMHFKNYLEACQSDFDQQNLGADDRHSNTSLFHWCAL